jgi:Rps23 Pro-64 3,4-dihydroxylase Tpa1-like proline 4-hydroxylase
MPRRDAEAAAIAGPAAATSSSSSSSNSSKRARGADGPAPPPAQPFSTSLDARHTAAATVASYAAQFRRGAPFPHLHVRSLLDPAFLRAARAELLAPTAAYAQKRNDLYEFLQSDGLATARPGSATAALRDAIYSPAFRGWVEAVTGVATNATVDVSAAQYVRGSHLLCHDDDLSARRIAYIIYLVPEDWDAERDGGTLDLFGADAATGMPTRVARRLAPEFNSMAFFEVSPVSFHQVAEVLSDCAHGPRLSVSGWFHGAAPTRRPAVPLVAPLAFSLPRAPAAAAAAAAGVATAAAVAASRPGAGAGVGAGSLALLAPACASGASDPLSHWVNAAYLRTPTVAQMRAALARDASLQLEGFLRPERLAEVEAVLGAQRWEHRGPPILHSYRALAALGGGGSGEGSASAAVGAAGILPDAVQRLREFLAGPAFFELVAAISGAALDGVAEEARCFARGDYTMITDAHHKQATARYKEEHVAERAAAAAAAGAGSAPPSQAPARGKGKGGGSRGAAAAETGEAEAGSLTDAGVRSVLEVTLCLCTGSSGAGASSSTEWPAEAGGYVCYLTSDEELLTVPPKRNALSLVLKEPGLMSFVKLVTARAEGVRYDVNLHFLVAYVVRRASSQSYAAAALPRS